MKTNNTNKVAIQRLTALWALNESGLGGLLHAFNSPFTGLIVGSIAIILISLICRLSDDKWKTMLTALTIVLIVKGAVSPHSNITAYFAVCFQALMGAFLFSIIKMDLLAAILLAVSSLIESSLQKLIGLTIIYGKTFWEAIDDLGSWLSLKIGFLLPFTASKFLIIGYVSLHAIVGIIVGIFCAKLLKSIHENWNNDRYNISISSADKLQVLQSQKPLLKSNFFWVFMLLTIISLVLYGYITDGWKTGLYILLRTAVVLLFLYKILGPILLHFINKFLKKEESKLGTEIQEVFKLFPYLRYLLQKAWNESKHSMGIKRVYQFLLLTLLYTLKFKMTE